MDPKSYRIKSKIKIQKLVSLQEKGERDLDTDTQREGGCVKTEAVFGAIQPSTRECREPSGAGRGRKDFLPGPLERMWPCRHLDIWFLLSIKVRERNSVVLSHHVCGNYYSSLGN